MADPIASPRSRRAASVSSAGTTMSAASLSFAPRFVPRPEPQYISRVAAAEHVEHISRRDQYEFSSPASSPVPQDHAIFTDSALALLNHFLDALLYSFLTKARSTSLSKLRTAITEVLKTRLARDALASADEEIQGLMDEAEINDSGEKALPNGRGPSRSPAFHLGEAYRVMRLRVMVFIKLGELDDEDEMEFFDDDEEPVDLSILNGPTAVFLASVLEYLAERLLDTAGEAAWARARSKASRRTPTLREPQEPEDDDMERVVVEDSDVEKIALNPMLGRLWRTWRKNYRSMNPSSTNASPSQSEYSRNAGGTLQSPRNMRRSSHERHASDSLRHAGDRHLTLEEVPEGEVSEHDIAANIPLPITENDVNEIEVPGLAKEMYDDGEEAPAPQPGREQWLPRRPSTAMGQRDTDRETSKPALTRMRSNSAPLIDVPSLMLPREADASERGFVLVFEGSDGQPVMEEIEDISAVDPEELTANAETSFGAEKVSQDGRIPLGRGEDVGIAVGMLTAANAAKSHRAKNAMESSSHKDKAIQPSSADRLGDRTELSHGQDPALTGLKAPISMFSSSNYQGGNGRVRQHDFMEPEVESFKDSQEEALEEEDPATIGVARTSDVKIQSHPSSPTPDQDAFYYNPVQMLEQARDARASAERNGAASVPDDYSLTDPPQTISSRYQALLREIARPEDLAALEMSDAVPDLDKSQPVSYAPVIPVFRHQQRSSESSYQSLTDQRRGPNEAATVSRGNKPAALQTSFRENDKQDEVLHPPSSAKSTATTPRSLRDSSSSAHAKTQRMSDEQRERDFDALIATAEPRVLTLTPEHLRDPKLDEQRWTTSAPPAATAKRSSSTSSKRTPPRTASRAGSVTVVQAPKPTSPTTTKNAPRVPQYRHSQSLSARPSAQNTQPGKKSGFVPREARVVTERLSDFADFMRSTAPSDESQATPYSISPRPSSSTSSTPKKAAGQRLEARSANAKAGGSDDLIDFIRRGPPSGEIGEHRIPRTVAPFRSTMDSDDFKDLPSSATTNGTSQNGVRSPKSPAVSSGPSSARTTQPSITGTSSDFQSFASGPPPRKQRRVKDPYALDSDDEEDLLTALPINGPRRADAGQQESLADFLRATEPPREPRIGNSNAAANSSKAPVGASAVRSTGPASTVAASSSSARQANNRARLEARSAGRTQTFGESSPTTLEIADFLRSSGPPEPVATPPPLQLQQQSRPQQTRGQASGPAPRAPSTRLARSTSGRRFWQRKTVEGT